MTLCRIAMAQDMQSSDRIGRRIKLHDLHVLTAVVQAGSMSKAAAIPEHHPVHDLQIDCGDGRDDRCSAPRPQPPGGRANVVWPRAAQTRHRCLRRDQARSRGDSSTSPIQEPENCASVAPRLPCRRGSFRRLSRNCRGNIHAWYFMSPRAARKCCTRNCVRVASSLDLRKFPLPLLRRTYIRTYCSKIHWSLWQV